MATDYTNDGIVDAPVVVSAVSALLNMSQSNLSEVVNDTISWTPEQVCTHDNVNAWAKYKPVPFYGVVKKDTFYTNGKWEKGEDSDGWWYGSGTPVMNAPRLDASDLVNSIANSEVWTRVVPEGGISQPYRLSDFIGYKHTARCPIRTFMPYVIYVNNSNKAGVTEISYDDYEYSPEDVYKILKTETGADILVGAVIRYQHPYGETTIEETIEHIVGSLSAFPTIEITFGDEERDSMNNYLYKMYINGNEVCTVLYNITQTTILNIGIYLKRDIDVGVYYSAKFDSNSMAHKVYSLTHESKYIEATLEYKTVAIAKVENGIWYINYQGTIFEISGYITGFTQGELDLQTSESFDFESLHIRLYQKLSLDDEQDESIYPDLTLLSKTNRNSSSSLSLDLPSSFDNNNTVSYAPLEIYETEDDAYYNENSQTVYGYPIIYSKRLGDGSWEDYGSEFEIGAVSTAIDRFTRVSFNRLEVILT